MGQISMEIYAPTGSLLSANLQPLFKNKKFVHNFIESWVKSNPNGPKASKNEHGFWSWSDGKRVRVGPVFEGVVNSLPSAPDRQGDYNVLMHTHPFTVGEGGQQSWSNDIGQDLAMLNSLLAIGVLMSHNGVFLYDGR